MALATNSKLCWPHVHENMLSKLVIDVIIAVNVKFPSPMLCKIKVSVLCKTKIINAHM